MATMKIVNPRLMWFVWEMRHKLAVPKNQAKGDWRDNTQGALARLMLAEVAELWELASDGDAEPQLLIEECADIANFAMMLADKIKFDYMEYLEGNKDEQRSKIL